MSRLAAAALFVVLASCAGGSTGALGECPPSSVRRNVCRQCGPNDACQRAESICALVCSTRAECGSGEECLGGACVPVPCG